MLKFRAYFDKDRETKWLNEMAAQGWAMNGFLALVYSFERCQPGEYIYQIDMTDSFGVVNSDYSEFMREAGVEIMCTWGFWVVLRKRAAEGPFELYTDVESRIRHYSKIRRLFKVALILETVCLVIDMMATVGSKGSWLTIGCVFLIGAVMILMGRELRRVSDILAELKERIGESAGCLRRRRVSGFVPVGLLFNAMGILLHGCENEIAGGHLVRGVCVILALVFLVIGFVRTAQERT